MSVMMVKLLLLVQFGTMRMLEVMTVHLVLRVMTVQKRLWQIIIWLLALQERTALHRVSVALLVLKVISVKELWRILLLLDLKFAQEAHIQVAVHLHVLLVHLITTLKKEINSVLQYHQVSKRILTHHLMESLFALKRHTVTGAILPALHVLMVICVQRRRSSTLLS